MMYYYTNYNYNPDYLAHYGVQGMRWGQHLFGKIQTASSNHKAKKAAIKAERKALKKSYAEEKGPKKGVFNVANSAARSFYRKERTHDFSTYRKQESKQQRKEGALTDEQVKAGRYRVAKARNIRRKVASVAVGTIVATGVAATGGAALAPLLTGAALGVGAGTVTNVASGGMYYAGQQKTYGDRRAKYQAKVNVKNQQKNSD